MAELSPKKLVALRNLEGLSKLFPDGTDIVISRRELNALLDMSEECLRLREEREGQRVATKVAMDVADMCMADEDTMRLREELAAARVNVQESDNLCKRVREAERALELGSYLLAGFTYPPGASSEIGRDRGACCKAWIKSLMDNGKKFLLQEEASADA
ncbi:MAG: hypothetical protein PHT33_05640 [bacterium]|nr:hypothetical protein [bacterium]